MPDGGTSARDLVLAVHTAARLGALWGFESRLATGAIDHLCATVRHLAAERGDLVLRFTDGMVSLDGERLRGDFASFAALRHLSERAARRGVGEVRIAATAARRDLVALLRLLEGRGPGVAGAESPCDDALAELSRAGASGIGLSPASGSADAETEGAWSPADVLEAAKRAWVGLAHEASECRAAAGRGERPTVRRVRRAVHDAIDVLERGDHHLLAAAQTRNLGGFAASHAANTCVLACALALRTGLHRTAAADLGVAAALHDLRPHDPEHTDEATLGERDRRIAGDLLPLLGFGDGALRAVLAVRDLRAPLDGTAPLSRRILRVACFFDTATTPAGIVHPGHAPRDVLRAMARDPSRFDTAIVRLLRGLLGTYPFGSVVQLDTGERAVVHARNPHFDQPSRPVVRLLDAQDGRPRDGAGALADLSRFDRDRGTFARSIVHAWAPWEAWRSPADYLRSL